MSWLQKLLPPRVQSNPNKQRSPVPEGVWSKCSACEAILYQTDVDKNLHVCSKCGQHMRIGARKRLEALLDSENKQEIGSEIESVDPLKFKDSKLYKARLSEAKEKTGEKDALIVMSGTIEALPVVVACFEFEFMGGSMGSVVGERFARGVQHALDIKAPFVCITASGGARMQESLLSLMQMAKTTAMVSELSQAGLPFITVLTHPTMGGVSASFAFLGDVVLAEPKALIGFAGPRVIEQAVGQTLPPGFQRAEFLLKKGAIDRIVDRRELRSELRNLLGLLMHKGS